MKQSFVRKIAALMCAVMLLCSLPMNIGAYAAENAKAAAVTEKAENTVNPESQQELTEVLKKIIESVKKIVVAIASYLEEQEKLEQEQAKPEITPPANNTNDERDLSETGIVGYLFDPNEKCFYTASDPWQRIVGYNELFDIFSEHGPEPRHLLPGPRGQQHGLRGTPGRGRELHGGDLEDHRP